jgi:restriction system protein
LAEVASLNARLSETYDEIDSILSATLAVDDFVDLEQLRVVVQHPPFVHSDLEVLTPSPVRIAAPPEPELVEPEAPTGLGGVFGGKKKHAEALAAARAAFAVTHQAWQAAADAVPARQRQQMQERSAAEAQRMTRLKQARRVYRRECAERDVQAATTNRR